MDFAEAEYLRIEEGAAALAGPIEELISQLLADGARNIHFLGTGGAGMLMQPACDLLRAHSTFPTFLEWPAELMLMDSINVGEGSVVIIPSRSGDTPESVEAMKWAQKKGATVVTLTGHESTPLARFADHNFTTYVDDPTSSEAFYMESLAIAMAIMKARGEYPEAAALLKEIRKLPAALLAVKRDQEEAMQRLASTLAQEPFHIITGAGPCWTEAFYYSMCILEEMQWIRTRPVHASDFFHGPLELLDEQTSVVVLKGEDSSRPLADRVETFARQITKKVEVIDTAEFGLPGVSREMRALVAPAALAAALERASVRLEQLTGHPLTTRRYYRRINY